MSWYIKALKNYVAFDGRARRKEYWMFSLIDTLIMILLVVLGAIGVALLETPGIFGILATYLLATALPRLAVQIRRMHDINLSGWWIICPFANVVFYLMSLFVEGGQGNNRFGPDPKELLN